MQRWSEPGTAPHPVYLTQVYDIVSAEAMLPFLKVNEHYPNGRMIQLPRPAPKVYSDLLPLLYERTAKGWKRVQ